MKTVKTILFSMLLFTSILACKNEKSAESDSEAVSENSEQMQADAPKAMQAKPGFASLSFKMDGELVEGTIPGVMAIYNPAKNEVNIRGNTPKGLFAVIIDDVTGTGTYTIKGTSNSGAGVMMKTEMYEVKKTGTPFTVTITAVEDITAVHAPEAKAIRGTFEGKIMDDAGKTISITDGKFSSQ